MEELPLLKVGKEGPKSPVEATDAATSPPDAAANALPVAIGMSKVQIRLRTPVNSY